MQAGKLNRRVTIQYQGAGHDEWNQPIPAWADLVTVWANIRHLSGRETIKADAVTSTVRASIRIRYRADVDAGMRVIHQGTVYSIVAVLPDEQRREYVDLVCEVVS